MLAAWDTTLLSRLVPGSPAHRHCQDAVARGDPVALAAGALLEVGYGYERERERRPEFGALLRWLEEEVALRQLCSVVPLDGRAALLAGRLRALAPSPPRARRGDTRTKTRRRAAWHLDLQIAATCWAGGYDVATENRRDFERIAEILAELVPEAPRLRVSGRPF